MMNETAHAGRMQSKRSVRLWDFLSSHSGSTEQMQAPVRQLAIRLLGLVAGQRVLDVGCGTGPNFEALWEAVGPEGHITGVDVSPKMVLQAEERVRSHGWVNVDVVIADASRETLGEETYDAAISTFSLSATADVRQAIENVYAALRPGGRLFVCDLRLIPRGHAALLIGIAGLAYRLIAGWTGRDVLQRLEATFDTVDIVTAEGTVPSSKARIRGWPPVVLAIATKASDVNPLHV